MTESGNRSTSWTPALGGPRGAQHLVVAEDDEALRDIVALTLEAAGYEVTKARNGDVLFDLLWTRASAGELVDLVICDVRMPGRDGLDVLREVRGGPAAVPFLFLTAFPDEVTLQMAESLGAVAVLDKPFDLDDLKSVVWYLVGPPGERRAIEPKKTPTAH